MSRYLHPSCVYKCVAPHCQLSLSFYSVSSVSCLAFLNYCGLCILVLACIWIIAFVQTVDYFCDRTIWQHYGPSRHYFRGGSKRVVLHFREINCCHSEFYRPKTDYLCICVLWRRPLSILSRPRLLNLPPMAEQLADTVFPNSEWVSKQKLTVLPGGNTAVTTVRPESRLQRLS